MHSIASDVLPEPPPPRNFRGMIRSVQDTPTTPTPLFPTAPNVPDVCVPWPLSSMGSLSLLIQSQPRVSSTNPFASSSIPFPGFSLGFVQMFAARDRKSPRLNSSHGYNSY